MKKKARSSGQPNVPSAEAKSWMSGAQGSRPQRYVGLPRWPTRIHFPRASSTPTGASLTVLRRYAEWLADDRVRRLFVLGHANKRLWDRAALGLADARARSVRDLLIFLGAKPEQVRRVSPARLHGAGPDSTRGERAAHRCVELIVSPDGSNVSQKEDLPSRGPARVWQAARRQRRPGTTVT